MLLNQASKRYQSRTAPATKIMDVVALHASEWFVEKNVHEYKLKIKPGLKSKYA